MPTPNGQNALEKMQLELDEAKKEIAQMRTDVDNLQAAEGDRLESQRDEQIKEIEETLRILKQTNDSRSNQTPNNLLES